MDSISHQRAPLKDLIEEKTKSMVEKIRNVNKYWEDLNNFHQDYINGLIKQGGDLHKKFYEYVKKISDTCLYIKERLNNILEELEIAKANKEIDPTVYLEISKDVENLYGFFENFVLEGDDFIINIETCKQDIKKDQSNLIVVPFKSTFSTAKTSIREWVRYYCFIDHLKCTSSKAEILDKLFKQMNTLQAESKLFSRLMDEAAKQLVDYLKHVVNKKPESDVTVCRKDNIQFGNYIKDQVETMICIVKVLKKGVNDIKEEASKNRIITSMFFKKSSIVSFRKNCT